MNAKKRQGLHVGVIMDGNGRWARRRHLPRFFGHRAGAERIENLIPACEGLDIRYLTLYAFSTENWSRPRKEVSFIFGLLAEKIKARTDDLVARGVRVRFLGDREALDANLRGLMGETEEKTRSGRVLDLVFCFNYGAQDEIVRACRQVCRAVAGGSLDPAGLTPRKFERYLDAPALPPLDLVIRTSGEQRLSNFMLYRAAYAELYFTEVLWPDFTLEEMKKALAEFESRQRRFGRAS